MRWRHPKLGLLGPNMFLPIAESTGLIVQIGDWVLREACREAKNWPEDIKVAVNLSPVQFQRGAIVATTVSALAEAELPPNRLELEITESVLLDKTERNLRTLENSARARRQNLDGRFRHRLFEPELFAQFSVRQDQDRPVLRAQPVAAMAEA